MIGRPVFLLLLLPLAAGSCGRLGYDQLVGGSGRVPGSSEQGGGGSTADSGVSNAGGGATFAGGSAGTSAGSGSGGFAADGAANSGGATGGGGSTVDAGLLSGGATGSGGAIATGGVMGTGGAIATGGATGSGGAIATGGVTGTGGAGGAGTVGCADGEREGFVDLVAYPDIAACAGGFALPGVIGLAGPACAHDGGDDGPFPDGTGCNASDLCAISFHLCANAAEVAAKSSTGCAGAAVGASPVFYVVAQPGTGQAKCGATGTDDVYGCGTMGGAPNVDCAPLNAWSGDGCKSLTPPWSCTKPTEALNVVKPGGAGGGALCCR